MIQRILLLTMALLFIVEIFSGAISKTLIPAKGILVHEKASELASYKTLSKERASGKYQGGYKVWFDMPQFAKNVNNTDILVTEYFDVDNIQDTYHGNMDGYVNRKIYGGRFWYFYDRNAFLGIRQVDLWDSVNIESLQVSYALTVEYFNEQAVLGIYQVPINNIGISSTVPEPELLVMLAVGLLGICYKKQRTLLFPIPSHFST